jgi:hypothetical protein
MKRRLYVTCGGHTNPSLRLPNAILQRRRAGETVAALADDYGIPAEQVRWGIELAAWREAVESMTATRQQAKLIADFNVFAGDGLAVELAWDEVRR